MWIKELKEDFVVEESILYPTQLSDEFEYEWYRQMETIFHLKDKESVEFFYYLIGTQYIAKKKIPTAINFQNEWTNLFLHNSNLIEETFQDKKIDILWFFQIVNQMTNRAAFFQKRYMEQLKKNIQQLINESKTVAHFQKQRIHSLERTQYIYIENVLNHFHLTIDIDTFLQMNWFEGSSIHIEKTYFQSMYSLLPIIYKQTEDSFYCLKEIQLEDYLCGNLSLIEDDLHLFKRQYVLEKGRIDMLCMDAKGVPVIIELKIESDTDLHWQYQYYSDEIEREWGVKPRFIVIAPTYEKHIMDYLKQHNVTIYTYKEKIKEKELVGLSIKKR